MKKKGKLYLILNRLQTMLAIKLHERVWRRSTIQLKHLFFAEHQNKTLIVSFPAFDEKAAKYNYIRSLNKFKGNKLFLLDNFASNGRGNYLIGPGVEDTVIELFQHIITKYKIEELIFIGSSKGGYSALNFSLHFPNVKVCIGAPQYKLGNYLSKNSMQPNLESIIGESTQEKIELLNMRLHDKIMNSSTKPTMVAIHYSNKEHTYGYHIQYMVADMKAAGFKVTEDVAEYPKHGDVAFYYPPFLEKTLNSWINQKEN